MLFILYIPFCNSTTYIKSKIIKQMQRFRLCRSAAEKLSETSRQIHHYFEPDDTFGLWQCCSFFAEKNHLIEQKSNLQIKQSKFKAKQRSAIEFTWFLRITLCLFHLLDCAYLQFLERRANILKSSSMALYEGKRNYKIINNVKLCKAPWTLNQSWFVPMEALLSSQLFDPR